MIRWVKRHYDKDKAKEVIAENYRKLPFVKSVEVQGRADSIRGRRQKI